MNIQKLQALVIDALEDVKAQDIKLFDTAHLSSMFERMVVASGTSNRQTRALAVSVRDKVKAAGGLVIGFEGEDTGEWVLVDLGDMVVHIMQAPIRAYYRLEELWGERPITLEQAKAAAKNTDDTAPAAKPKRTARRADSAKAALEVPKKVRTRPISAAAAAAAAATSDAPKPTRSRRPAATKATSAAASDAPKPARVRKPAAATASDAPKPARARKPAAAKASTKTATAAAPVARTRKPRAKAE